MISNQSVYFLHIPKTAGTSLRVWLENQFHYNTICPAYTLYEALQLELSTLRNYRLYRGHMGHAFLQLLDRRPFVLTILRDPVERVISHFEYVRHDPTQPLYRYINENRMSLADFLQQRPRPNFVDDMQTRALASELDPAIVQAENLRGCSAGEFQRILRQYQPKRSKQERLALAIEHLETISVAGTLERFEDTLQLISYHLDAVMPDSGHRLNTNLAKTDYGHTLREAIGARNRCDMELYRIVSERLDRDYRTMVRQLLQASRLRRQPADLPSPANRIFLSMEDPLAGENWYQREHKDMIGFYRWTGPGNEATVVLDLHPGTSYHLRVHILDAADPELLDSLAILHNDQQLSIELSRQDGLTMAGSRIDAAEIHPDYRSVLTLRVAQTLRVTHGHAGLAETGHRHCGLAIRQLELIPA